MKKTPWERILFNISRFAAFFPVIVIGILGIALAYPLYQRMVEKERARVAPEILKLSQELLYGGE